MVMHEIQIFPHLDSHWLWRWLIADERGVVLATSPLAYMFLVDVKNEIELVRALFARN
jgi:hypothetical protein